MNFRQKYKKSLRECFSLKKNPFMKANGLVFLIYFSQNAKRKMREKL